MSLRHIIYFALALVGGFAAIVYLRRAVQQGIRLRDFQIKDFARNDANLDSNPGVYLLAFAIIAAASSVGLFLKAFGKW
jgi:hypothetical protein